MMDGDDIFKILISGAVTIISAIVAWFCGVVMTTKTMAEQSANDLRHLEKRMDGVNDLPERIAALEAQVRSTSEGLQRGMDRIEAHLVRQEKSTYHDKHK